ncbi:MAG: glycosyltransferase family 2 protein [Acidobacteria bacterium]|nr:glycosyltransferase family 2 protein [Acidobacteriota bacterium]
MKPSCERQGPEISIIIVTWNGRQYLDACLRAAEAQQGVSAEIIVVDNGSTDGSAEFVRARFPHVRVVELTENRGFTGGNNAGAREARGAYVAFLNNDTVAEDTWLRALRAGVDMSAGFALVTSRIVYMHDPRVIDSAGDGLLRWGGAFKWHHGQSAELADAATEVFGVCGAACLMPKSVFEEIGGFDDDFFASHEDVDLSYRARLRGYRCRYVPDAIVRHHGSATLGTATAQSVFHGQRNLEWLYLKNTPASLLLRTLPGHLVYTVAAAAHFSRLGVLMPFIRAKMAAIGGLPEVLRKRRLIQRSRVVGAAGIEPYLERRWFATKLREKRFDSGLSREKDNQVAD